MTRTQLQEMSDRDLVEHAKSFDPDLERREHKAAKVIEALADRLDDRYPFFVMTDEQKRAWEEAMTAPSAILEDLTWKETTEPLSYIRQTPTETEQ